jgi:hypothetical protein
MEKTNPPALGKRCGRTRFAGQEIYGGTQAGVRKPVLKWRAPVWENKTEAKIKPEKDKRDRDLERETASGATIAGEKTSGNLEISGAHGLLQRKQRLVHFPRTKINAKEKSRARNEVAAAGTKILNEEPEPGARNKVTNPKTQI